MKSSRTIRSVLTYAAIAPLLWSLAACERESGPDVTQKTDESEAAKLAPVHRVELASGAIPPGREKPHVFKVLSVTVPAGETIEYAAGEGLVFQISGSQTVTVNGQATTLAPNQGFHIETGLPATFAPLEKEQPSVFLHFLLVPDQQADRVIDVKSAQVTELYRAPDPVPAMNEQAHRLTLTQLSIPPSTPHTDAHHRTGAALYYVLSGTGEFVHQETREEKSAGSVVYEPSGMVHQWANPGDQPLQLVVANVSPEEGPAIKTDADRIPDS